jgi:ornithine cyclodeaminase/alanine dehydrogenase-like protein (mu-crystallin family)
MQLEALRRVIPLQRVFAFDTDPQRAREMDATPVTTLESRDTDIWVTCTHSRTPFLRREHVRDGAFVAAVGADNPSKSEITPELMAAARIVTDVTDQCAEIGDLHHAIAAGVVTRDDVIAELGQVVAGRTVRKSDADIVIFDSTGTGFQDTAAAALIYERARR